MKTEFSRTVKLDRLGSAPETLRLEATAEERQALAQRFRLTGLDRLEAEVELVREGSVIRLAGRVKAALSQPCVATGEPVPQQVDEPVALLFVPAGEHAPDEEIELSHDECDIVDHDGLSIDVGEAIAQSLALALEPYPRSAGAADALKAAGVKSEGEAGPFAGLAGLRDSLERKP